MELRVTFQFDSYDIAKYEMKKEMQFFAEYLADKYDADIYKVRIEEVDGED